MTKVLSHDRLEPAIIAPANPPRPARTLPCRVHRTFKHYEFSHLELISHC